MNKWILIVKDDVYKYKVCKWLMIKAKIDNKSKKGNKHIRINDD